LISLSVRTTKKVEQKAIDEGLIYGVNLDLFFAIVFICDAMRDEEIILQRVEI